MHLFRFDPANRLITATQSAGTTSYSYDHNGNLVQILPPSSAISTSYGYSQRNMLITVTQTVSNSTATLANYRYDGDNARYQQIDYSSGVTTTYHNDIVGLSQVLIADDGTTQTANLFGLDLIASDDGTTTLTMLPNGLGSVRVEMVGEAVNSVTTYEPYGTLLMRTGSSGTIYGYTGEQEDAITNLLYLRARYYAPHLKVFLSKDPFLGYTNNSTSQNGYTYAHANPALFTDPTGFCAEIGDDACWSFAEYLYFKYYVSWDYLGLLTLSELRYLEQNELELNATLLRSSPPNYIGDDPPYVQLFGQYGLAEESNWDGIAVFGAIKSAEVQFSNQAGFELLYNFRSYDWTLFAVIGFGGAAGGAATADGALVFVHNIGDDNLKYDGNFVSLTIGGAYGYGGSIGYALAPEDVKRGRFTKPQEAYSVSVGVACGVGGYISWGTVEYLPIYTVNNRTGRREFHDYFLDTENKYDNGFVTEFFERLSGIITDFLESD